MREILKPLETTITQGQKFWGIKYLLKWDPWWIKWETCWWCAFVMTCRHFPLVKKRSPTSCQKAGRKLVLQVLWISIFLVSHYILAVCVNENKHVLKGTSVSHPRQGSIELRSTGKMEAKLKRAGLYLSIHLGICWESSWGLVSGSEK
jgi:hypothetical protein